MTPLPEWGTEGMTDLLLDQIVAEKRAAEKVPRWRWFKRWRATNRWLRTTTLMAENEQARARARHEGRA